MTPKTARNTDGIDPGSSRNITIAYSYIHTGDDDVCLKPSAAGAVSNMSVIHDHFYTGHGMSIGSGTYGGVDHLFVDDLTIDGADNGLRIKSDPSRGGLVHQVLYRNVCIRNVPNPLVFTPHYTTFTGDRLPIYKDITLENVHILTPGAYTFLRSRFRPQARNQARQRLCRRSEGLALATTKTPTSPSAPNSAILSQRATTSPSRRRPTQRPASRSTATRALFHSLQTPTAPGDGGESSAGRQHSLRCRRRHRRLLLHPARARHGSQNRRRCSALSRPAPIAKCSPSTSPTSPFAAPIPTPSKTIVVNDRSAGQNGGTLHSATVNVTADNFFAENITFENDFNRTHPQLPQGSQALAFHVTGDRAIFHNVRLLGNQDTVYLGSRNCAQNTQGCTATRQYFSDCYIAGNVDFIFGDCKAVFENCEFTPRRTTAASSPRNPSTIPTRTPALSSTTANSLPIPASPAPSISAAPGVPTQQSSSCTPDGRQDRSRRLARMASRRNALARHRLLCRIRFHRPGRASRRARSAHALPHARRGQTI